MCIIDIEAAHLNSNTVVRELILRVIQSTFELNTYPYVQYYVLNEIR